MKRTVARVGIVICLSGILAGCSKSGDNSYDESQMDLKPVAAHVSANRHTGELSDGTALTHGPQARRRSATDWSVMGS